MMLSVSAYLIFILLAFGGGIVVSAGLFSKVVRARRDKDFFIAVGALLLVLALMVVGINRDQFGGMPVSLSEVNNNTFHVYAAILKGDNIVLFVKDGDEERLVKVTGKLFTDSAFASLHLVEDWGAPLQKKRIAGLKDTATEMLGLPEENKIDLQYELLSPYTVKDTGK